MEDEGKWLKSRRGAPPRAYLERHTDEQVCVIADLWQALAHLRAAEEKLRKQGVEPLCMVLETVVHGQEVLGGVIAQVTARWLQEGADGAA